MVGLQCAARKREEMARRRKERERGRLLGAADFYSWKGGEIFCVTVLSLCDRVCQEREKIRRELRVKATSLSRLCGVSWIRNCY